MGSHSLYARKVEPEGKDGFESKQKDLVEPGNLFQVYCEFVTLNQDFYQLQASIVIKNITSHVYFSFITKTIQ